MLSRPAFEFISRFLFFYANVIIRCSRRIFSAHRRRSLVRMSVAYRRGVGAYNGFNTTDTLTKPTAPAPLPRRISRTLLSQNLPRFVKMESNNYNNNNNTCYYHREIRRRRPSAMMIRAFAARFRIDTRSAKCSAPQQQ